MAIGNESRSTSDHYNERSASGYFSSRITNAVYDEEDMLGPKIISEAEETMGRIGMLERLAAHYYRDEEKLREIQKMMVRCKKDLTCRCYWMDDDANEHEQVIGSFETEDIASCVDRALNYINNMLTDPDNYALNSDEEMDADKRMDWSKLLHEYVPVFGIDERLYVTKETSIITTPTYPIQRTEFPPESHLVMKLRVEYAKIKDKISSIPSDIRDYLFPDLSD